MKKKSKLGIVIFVWGFFILGSIFLPKKDFSLTERRKLAQFPELTVKSITSGSFMKKFEEYTLDQFPFRDSFRTLKANITVTLFGEKDNNLYYKEDGYINKLDFPLQEGSVTHALNRIQNIYQTYLKDNNHDIYISVVPDKGYYMPKKEEYPHMDYDRLFQMVREQTDFAEYIDLTTSLDLSSYYRTDTHWRQEKLETVADTIRSAMKHFSDTSYQEIHASDQFLGVYGGQSAFSSKGEELNYLTNDVIEACKVTNIENPKTTKVYDLEKAKGRDPYELFLSGATPLTVIDNPNAKSKKELVLFRDSFGSSLAPLLIADYSKITLVDIRYMDSKQIKDYISFKDQDILFLYSSLLLNSSYTMK